MRFGNGTRPHLVTATHAGDFGEEQTEPGVDVVVSNRTLYKLLQRMNARLTWLAAGLFFVAGSVLLMAVFFWWSRPR